MLSFEFYSAIRVKCNKQEGTVRPNNQGTIKTAAKQCVYIYKLKLKVDYYMATFLNEDTIKPLQD